MLKQKTRETNVAKETETVETGESAVKEGVEQILGMVVALAIFYAGYALCPAGLGVEQRVLIALGTLASGIVGGAFTMVGLKLLWG